MKTTAVEPFVDKKGHKCPPSNATHPRDRWETLFVYSFICKFTTLRAKVEGLDTPSDFEDALLSHEPHHVMTQILTRFVLNLRPQARNVSPDLISSTVIGVLSDFFKTPERSVFWDEDLRANVDPFQQLDGGFFAASWDLKLLVLRQLVELQLTHSPEIKGLIDQAWGVAHTKHKKKEATDAPVPDASDPHSAQNLQFQPIGQDVTRKRYWIVDDSPRVYVSTNPWKITATFHAVSSTREEYLALVEKVKASAPPEPKEGERRHKPELSHLALVTALESRIEVIDKEIARIQKARKKIEQRNLLMAQAEIRETRTRRQTRRPDYVYYDGGDSDNDKDDEYTYQDDVDDEAEFMNGRSDSASGSTGHHAAIDGGRRRSTRTAVVNGNGKRAAAAADEWTQWRGERRSTRLGAPLETQLDEPPPKRARTVGSRSVSVNSGIEDMAVDLPADKVLPLKHSGAAAVKPTEVAMEQVAGRKKSKFWYYAVEPAPMPPGDAPASYNGADDTNLPTGLRNGPGVGSDFTSNESVTAKATGLEGSLSPPPSIEA
ncbi:hypothetical protein BV25DRAFT_1867186 [Artomyces pyxidatus]|uniref:Uncharacterized protein n=1 Tax=Artomyces pyxidatus TaxID=48021 RepID=A0ACB8TI76_9AGAM|nr:hypothetical protein BV25DRAFT_1867186 [Artomyces pyxidatus]